jgi:hypothetical protein
MLVFDDISGIFQSGFFITSGPSHIINSPDTITEFLQEMRNMNRGVRQNMLSKDIAAALW